MPQDRGTPGQSPSSWDDGRNGLLSKRFGLRLTRRRFLLALGVGIVGAACGRGGKPLATSQSPRSIRDVIGESPQLSILGTGADAPPMSPGPNRFGFALLDIQGQPIVGGAPAVWLARDEISRPMGPYTAAWHPFTAYQKTEDDSPVSPLPGAFATEVAFPSAGTWLVAVTVGSGYARQAGSGLLPITDGPLLAGLGTKAISTSTPVATTASGIEEICTRTPVDRMHYISLDDALASGKPTVACFSTPLLCESRLCGPVTDEQILVFEQYGPDRANFIHVEEFLPGPDHTPPAATLETRSPAFKAWKLETEPWVFVIDRDGVIRFRSVGPVTAPEIEAALRQLL